MGSQHTVRWHDAGELPTQPANPDYPKGIDLDVAGGALEVCTVLLRPYPAPRIGVFVVTCQRCGFRAKVTTAGRADDPRSIRLPCIPTAVH